MSNPVSPSGSTSNPPLTFGQNTPFLFHSLAKTKPWQAYDPGRWHTAQAGPDSGFHIGVQDVEMSDGPRGHGGTRLADGSPSHRRASGGAVAHATTANDCPDTNASVDQEVSMELDARPIAKGGMKRELRRRGRRKEQEAVPMPSEPVSSLVK